MAEIPRYKILVSAETTETYAYTFVDAMHEAMERFRATGSSWARIVDRFTLATWRHPGAANSCAAKKSG